MFGAINLHTTVNTKVHQIGKGGVPTLSDLSWNYPFGNKTVLEPSQGGDAITNLGGSRRINLDKNT